MAGLLGRVGAAGKCLRAEHCPQRCRQTPQLPQTSNAQKVSKILKNTKTEYYNNKKSSFGPLMLPPTSIAQKAKVFLSKDFQTF